jgi:hypothetical protein
MIELADILRLHGPAYRAKFGNRILPSHRRAMRDIEQCRTAALGGQVYYCDQCQQLRYSYHSCQNRHCPKCGNDQANQWLQAQQDLLLPTHYFLVTFTLPAELRPLARSNQKLIYNLLFRAASQALLKLAQDERFVGSQLGMVGVLHTWTRQLIYHPHVHFIVTGGGLTGAGRWRASPADFLVHEKPLAIIFRAKLRGALKKRGLLSQVDRRVWKKDWITKCKPVGNGAAAFKYLAPYIFRVALSNRRLVKFADGQVTFTYQESATKRVRRCTLSAEEFIRRFLQHVLPDRFVKVRYFGLLSPRNRHLLAQARQQLEAVTAKGNAPSTEGQTRAASYRLALGSQPDPPLRCHQCGNVLTLLGLLRPVARSP